MEISLQADPLLHDPLTSFLFDLGCTGVVSEDFDDRTLRAYLPFTQDPEGIKSRIIRYLQELSRIFPDIPLPAMRFSRVEEQDWGLEWRRFFRPVRVTQGLLILPAWEEPPETDAPYIIRMDPGPAFGTGQHPTTRMCLEAMERVGVSRPWTLLDVGTGSGILAIYGIVLGAERVLALDTDPEALRWASRNIELNRVSEGIVLASEPVEAVKERFPLICANLILGEILRLLPVLSSLLDPGGRLILSGILTDQVPEVAEACSRNGLLGHETLHQDEWSCVIAAKRA